VQKKSIALGEYRGHPPRCEKKRVTRGSQWWERFCGVRQRKKAGFFHKKKKAAKGPAEPKPPRRRLADRQPQREEGSWFALQREKALGAGKKVNRDFIRMEKKHERNEESESGKKMKIFPNGPTAEKKGASARSLAPNAFGNEKEKAGAQRGKG